MKNFTTFKTWYANVKENEVATATPTAADISTDVDTIINSLETLANELTEELNLIQIDEAGAVDFITAWITSIKAVNNQKKVNKIKMNAADLSFAAEKAEGPKKKALQDKSTAVNSQAAELQKMVDDRFSGKGGIVDRKLAKTKIEGQLEIIKRTSGMEDDPSVQSDLKTKMRELANKYKEEEAAIAKLEDDNKAAIDAERERQNKEANDTNAAEAAQATKDAEAAQATKDAETAQATKDAEDAQATKDAEDAPETKDAEDAPETKDAEDAPETKDAEDAKNDKEGKLKRLEDMLVKAKESGDEEKIKKVQDLMDRVSAKESWQLEGTNLGMMLESEIIKLQLSFKLNESKYTDLSIKDRFSRLI